MAILWKMYLSCPLNTVLKYRIITFWLFSSFCFIISIAEEGCQLENYNSKNSDPMTMREKELLQQISPLKGMIFSVIGEDDKTKESVFNYTIGICASPNPKYSPKVGAIQVKVIKGQEQKKNYTLGYYNSSDIMGGTGWITLTYLHGETYSGHCNESERMTRLMIVCDESTLAGKLTVLEERKLSTSEYCFYLFELNSKVACPKRPPQGLSAGSVFCIIFFTFAGTYFILGFLYQRLVVGAKGIEQIPNYGFWKDFGKLQADGCDYICRCGPRQESQAYRGIDDRVIRSEDEDRDDHLLAM